MSPWGSRLADLLRPALALLLTFGGAAWAESPLHKVGDDRIRQTMIQQSQHGACSCPWSLDRRQHPCGRHSQYDRPAGRKQTLCYATDISDAMVGAWRDRHNVHPPVP